MMKEQYPELHREIKARVIELVRSRNIDVIHCASLDSAEFVEDTEGCGALLHLVDSVTLEKRRELGAEKSLIGRLRKVHQLWWYSRISRYEKRVMRRFDATVTVGTKDFEVLTALSPRANIVLIPNGVDAGFFTMVPDKQPARPTVLFTGNMRFPPNMDAVVFFHDEVFPLIRKRFPDARFVIAGTSPARHIQALSDGDGVLVTGFVDDIRTVMADTDVIVCPMRIGGGIKNKILEAMAAGRPVVSTSLGAEGVDARHGETIMIADAPQAIADAVAALLKDRSLRDRIAARARRLVEERYTWELSSRKYEEVYEQLLRRRTQSK
ncbi:MAG: glycosyltransferase [Chitinivibrionia bacterium]|nr:glycosyltransferase [Chitinivibrionia bacterium]